MSLEPFIGSTRSFTKKRLSPKEKARILASYKKADVVRKEAEAEKEERDLPAADALLASLEALPDFPPGQDQDSE